MKTIQADKYRNDIIALLAAEKLPVADLPNSLDNFVVTTQNGNLTGVAGLEIYGDYGLLRSLAVDKAFRNRGIADDLLKQVETIAISKKLKALYLLTETATGYFTRKGYDAVLRSAVPIAVQQSSEFSHVCPQSAIVMVKFITNL